MYLIIISDKQNKVTVTADGLVLGTFAKKEFLTAFLVQFGALYVFGLDFEKNKNNKPSSKAIRDLFDFLTEYIMVCFMSSFSLSFSSPL